MITRDDLNGLADTLAQSYQIGVEQFQEPRQYTTRLDTWRRTVTEIVGYLSRNNPRFREDLFRRAIAKAVRKPLSALYEEVKDEAEITAEG